VRQPQEQRKINGLSMIPDTGQNNGDIVKMRINDVDPHDQVNVHGEGDTRHDKGYQ
jgi:hypothetical protein